MGQSPGTHSTTPMLGGTGPYVPARGGRCWQGHQGRHSLCPCRFGDDIPGMEGLGTGMGVPCPLCCGWGAGLAVGTAACGQAGGGHADAASFLSPDITVICPWEAFSHLELHELAQYGII